MSGFSGAWNNSPSCANVMQWWLDIYVSVFKTGQALLVPVGCCSTYMISSALAILSSLGVLRFSLHVRCPTHAEPDILRQHTSTRHWCSCRYDTSVHESCDIQRCSPTATLSCCYRHHRSSCRCRRRRLRAVGETTSMLEIICQAPQKARDFRHWWPGRAGN